MTDRARPRIESLSLRSLRLTRRGLLRAGALGTAAVWAGGRFASVARHGVPCAEAAERVALSASGEEILRAVTPVVLGSLLPADATARERALDAAMSSIDDYLAHLSLPLQREARDVFETLHLWPVRLVIVRTWRPWRNAPPEAIESFLHRARTSRISTLRRIYHFLQSMAVLAWFDLPAAWEGIGYPGIPIPRPAPPVGRP